MSLFAGLLCGVSRAICEASENMAQSTVPVYLTGKVGSIVYTGNRQGTAVRMLVTPANPNTPGQSAQRARFTTAAQAYKSLSASVQLAWKSFAATLKNNLSAFNAYVKVSITSQIVGTTAPSGKKISCALPRGMNTVMVERCFR